MKKWLMLCCIIPAGGALIIMISAITAAYRFNRDTRRRLDAMARMKDDNNETR